MNGCGVHMCPESLFITLILLDFKQTGFFVLWPVSLFVDSFKIR